MSNAATAITLFDQPLPHGITLACRAAGVPDAPRRALFLHGFPEAAFVWDDLIAALAASTPHGLRCVAPNLRGYAGSSAPAAIEAYRPKHLVADLQALIDVVAGPGQAIDLLVAHDWGGGVAWNLAALAPQRVKRLVIINSPHPGALLRELRDNPAQQAASAYMRDLVQPDAAQRLADHDFAGLWAMLSRFGAAPWLTPALREAYRAVWSQGLDGALNWYRASPLRPPAGPHDRSLAQLQLPPSVVNVAVPTTVLWGDADHALLPGLLAGLADWVPGVQLHRHPAASHWVVHEQPGWVLAQLQAVLAGG
jgi:pimeloyl-ACP methyl ester carboxylesterase